MGPILSHVFVNYTGDGIESTLTKFPDGAKCGAEVNVSQGQAIPKKPGRLEGELARTVWCI